jgi:alginate O-acetyltransferase complex protein AlgI
VLFTEPAFLFAFLPVLLALHLPRHARYRNALLLAASTAFYARGAGAFAWFLLASIALNYIAALAIGRAEDQARRRRLTVCAVGLNLAALVVLKYGDFLVANADEVLATAGIQGMPLPGLLLPIGISFFTFHTISYVVDVYRRDAVAQKGIVEAGLYLLFFPQLIAGPIIRYHDIASQLAARRLTLDGFADGVRRFVIGLGKKMLVANIVAGPVDRIFALPPDQLSAPLAWLAVGCYTLQIYFDFSGYSDMAIGLAAMFGFRFPENFRYPYAARSMQDFWRRWHLSLSAWFRDYVYVPLGGNRRSPCRTYLNLAAVFLLCGLWHGANWTFVVWGGYHGLFLVIERMGAGRRLDAWPRVVGHAYAILAVMIGWVFFRADSLGHAGAVLRAMAGAGIAVPTTYHASWYLTPELVLALMAGTVGALPVWAAVGARWSGPAANDGSLTLGWMPSALVLAVVLCGSIMLIAARTYDPFIYFRF